MLIEIGLCGAAAFLFGRGIYHSGVLSGWIAQGLRQPAPAPSLPPSEPPRFDVEAHEIALFRAVPSAWWLDPNRWGDNPHRDKKQPSSPSSPPRPLAYGETPVAWDEYFESEQRWIAERLGLVRLAPPPTRAETVKEAWRVVRDGWHRDAIDGRLIVAHDLGIIEPILFEQMRYGDEWVIEAEGVVVERLAAR